MKIRKLEKKDISKVILLEELYLGETLGKEILEESITLPHMHFYVIELEEVIGYIGSYILCSDAEILNFVINEKHQRKGYGQLLLDKIIDDSINEGVNKITLEVKVNNEKAINFYHKNEFKTVNIRKEYYADGSDAYLMIKEI